MMVRSAIARTFISGAFLWGAILLANCCPLQGASPQDSSQSGPIESLKSWLAQSPEARKVEELPANNLSKEQVAEATELLWNDRVEQLKKERAEEFKNKVIKLDENVMPFDYRIFGDKPESGRAMFISMHGGGGAPKRVNDQQWKNQIGLYKPEEGVYLAPRAPTDTWNLWHQGHIDPMFQRLIEDCILFEGVDPNKVYLMGYSAGGDGVYQVAPRMADRFAAASMMAGHPNESTPLSLRNLPFTLHMGANDSAYNRNEVAKSWGEQLDKLQAEDPEGYVHFTKLHEGKGHWMDRQDAEALPWMTQYQRKTHPKRIVWRQDDVTHQRFYWLAVSADQAKAGNEVRADIEGQTIAIKSDSVTELDLLLSDQLLDLDAPITVRWGDKTILEGKVERTLKSICTALQERLDKPAIYSVRLTVQNK